MPPRPSPEQPLDGGAALGAVPGASQRHREVRTRARQRRAWMRQDQTGRQARASTTPSDSCRRHGRAFAGEARASRSGQHQTRRSAPGSPPSARAPWIRSAAACHLGGGPRPGQRLLADLTQRVSVPALALRGAGSFEERGERGRPLRAGPASLRGRPRPLAPPRSAEIAGRRDERRSEPLRSNRAFSTKVPAKSRIRRKHAQLYEIKRSTTGRPW